MAEKSLSSLSGELGNNGSQNGRPSEPAGRGGTKDETTTCGFGALWCRCIEVFNSPKWFLLWCCFWAFFQSLVMSGINSVNASTYEKRFSLSSSQVSWLYNTNDIAGAIALIPISYLATHAHQPRLLSGMTVLLVAGNIVMALPHYLSGPYEYTNTQATQCLSPAANGSSVCDEGSSVEGLSHYLYVFIFGQVLLGISGGIFYVVAVLYLDSNVSVNSSPLYQAAVSTSSAIGPMVGFILGAKFLTYYVDFDTIDISSVTISLYDPAWVGAWWLGWIGCAVCVVPLIFIMAPYPKHLPQQKNIKRPNQAHDNGSVEIANQENFGRSFRDVPASLKLLFRNPTYVFIILVGVPDALVNFGILGFFSKAIQNQFGQTVTTSALLSGTTLVIGAGVGLIIGGLVSKCAKLKVRGLLIFSLVVRALSLLAFPAYFLYCPETDIAGVNIQYGSGNAALPLPALVDSCNANCSCTTSKYQPLCGADGKQYFNPCYAGCTQFSWTLFRYVDCSCIGADGSGAPGICQYSCKTELGVFLAVVMVTTVLTAMGWIPHQNACLRCIPHMQRSLGFGIMAIVGRLLGAGPGPILFGTLIDSACRVWQWTCGERGACWIYNKWELAWTLAVFILVMKVLIVVLSALALVFYKAPTAEEEEIAESSLDTASYQNIQKEDEVCYSDRIDKPVFIDQDQ